MIEVTFHDDRISKKNYCEQLGGLENTDGNGSIHCYSLFDGVAMMHMRFEMQAYTEKRGNQDALEINFCVNGRFETNFSQRDHVLLQPGDMAISCYDGTHGTQSESSFPLGYYEGICLEVVPSAAQQWITKNAPCFSVDFDRLKQNLLGNKWYMYGQAGPRCEHVFRELYENAAYFDFQYLQLKVVELLMLLSRIPRSEQNEPYHSTRQIERIQHIRDHLLTDRDNYVSLSQLAAAHDISVSHLQKLFKQIYGMPIYHYIKEYRLEQASVELATGSKCITQIAQDAGYDNASKFTAAFKRRYGMTPSQYRVKANESSKRSSQIKMG